MDPLSGGASVLAFVVLALKGTKVIYQTVSGIREAPQHVQDLSSSVASLSAVLEQLKETKALKEGGTHRDLRTFEDATKKCWEDVTRFSGDLEKIEVTSGERQVVKCWKRIKKLLCNEALHRMQWCIIEHKDTLQMHLSMLVSDISVRNDANMLLGIRHVLQNQTDHQSGNADVLAHHTSALTLVQKGIESVKDAQVTHASERQVASEQVTQKLTSIRSRVDKLPDISSQQSQVMQEMQEMLGKLAEILHRLPSREGEPLAAAPDLQDGSSSTGYSSKAESHSRGMDAGEKSACPDDLDREDGDLFHCVSRLSRLAQAESSRIVSDKAQSIIEDLEKLLQIISNQLVSSGSGRIREKKRRRSETFNTCGNISSDQSEQQRDLKRMRGLLTSSDEVIVNQRARPKMPLAHLRFCAQSSTSDYEMPSVTMTVTTKKKWLQSATGHKMPDDEDKQAEVVEFSATAVLMPKDPRLKAKMSAYFCQRRMQEGFFSIPPTLWIHPIVPRDAEVFDRVFSDDINGLIRLFRNGKASIRDCDPLGRSLLGYAVWHGSFDIAQFLVENGSEVNSLEHGFSFYQEALPPKQLLIVHNSPAADRCRRVLLDAGADVMLPFRVGPDELTCPLSVHLQYGSLGLVRKLLDSDSCDLDTDVRLENGRTVLLDYVFNHHRKNPQVIAMLLEKGADVHARDRDGNTCLHLYFKRLEQDMPSYNRDCLLSLIRSGADISAKNNLGWTVAETVGCGHLSRGYATDLWNTTLSHCGYDSADLRVSIPDKSRISWSYTALYYAALLRGDSWDEDDSRRWVEPHSYFTWKCLESVLPPLEFNLTSRISLQSDIWDTSHEELGLEHLSSTSTLSNDLSNMWNTIPELLRSLVISTHRPSV